MWCLRHSVVSLVFRYQVVHHDFRRQDGGGRGRAIFSGGYEAPSHLKEIQTVEIATTGNATDFGDMMSIEESVDLLQIQLVV